jgi:hypothetical protein
MLKTQLWMTGSISKKRRVFYARKGTKFETLLNKIGSQVYFQKS